MNGDLGQRLYQIIPALYRIRDNGDLLDYFAAMGSLLDRFQATLQQRLIDNFPDTPPDDSPACQEWLIPYFAQLLDVRLVSPSARARRAEVANAVRWRQGKGTLRVIEEIAQQLAGLEMVVHEGWRRVAITPRLNIPRIPATTYGYAQDAPLDYPGLAARHPGLPAATVDFRCPSGAVAAIPDQPGGQYSSVDGITHHWRQASWHGTPCWPGSYEDVSLHTVDFRDSDYLRGHFHPRKVLLYSAPPAGYFTPGMVGVTWNDPPGGAFLDRIEIIEEDGITTYRNKTWGTEHFVPVPVNGIIHLGQGGGGAGDPDFHTWRFEGLVLRNTVQVENGRIELEGCAARTVEVSSIDASAPVLSARGVLFKNIHATQGLIRLEYGTVLNQILCENIQASDCLLLGRISKQEVPPDPPDSGCVRYSRVLPDQATGGMSLSHGTRIEPELFNRTFGQRSCGVLHPACARVIRHGAEDSGEMGAYHDWHLSLLSEAVVDKLHEYLPVGLQAVVIPDARLLDMP
jgi:hypothetical protein